MSICIYCGGSITFRYIGGVRTPVHLSGGCSGEYNTFRANNYTQVERRSFEINKLYRSDYTEKDFCQPTKCPKCEQKVFFIRHNGGSVWLDELGYPWTKHPCMDKSSASGWKDINIVSKAEIRHMTFGLCTKVKVIEEKKDDFLTYAAVLLTDKTIKIFCLKEKAARILGRVVSIGRNKKNITVIYSPDSISYPVLNENKMLSENVFDFIEDEKKSDEIQIIEDTPIKDNKKTRGILRKEIRIGYKYPSIKNKKHSSIKKEDTRNTLHIVKNTNFKPSEKFTLINGVAIDNETGLTWLRFAYGQNWDGEIKGTPKLLTLNELSKAIKSFNFAGHSDWRLPTIEELKTLIDTNKEIFSTENQKHEKFWSLITNANFTKIFDFFDGTEHLNFNGNKNYARLVRKT